MGVGVVVDYADTFLRISSRKQKVRETAFVCSYGAQVESFKQKHVQKSLDTVPLRAIYKDKYDQKKTCIYINLFRTRTYKCQWMYPDLEQEQPYLPKTGVGSVTFDFRSRNRPKQCRLRNTDDNCTREKLLEKMGQPFFALTLLC